MRPYITPADFLPSKITLFGEKKLLSIRVQQNPSTKKWYLEFSVEGTQIFHIYKGQLKPLSWTIKEEVPSSSWEEVLMKNLLMPGDITYGEENGQLRFVQGVFSVLENKVPDLKKDPPLSTKRKPIPKGKWAPKKPAKTKSRVGPATRPIPLNISKE